MAIRRQTGGRRIRGGPGMALTERVKSRELTEVSGRATLDFEYDLVGTSSEIIARNYLVDNTPRVYENLFRMEFKVTPIQVDEGTDTGHWLCTVRYATGDVVPRELTDSSFAFDTTGGTQHITQSLGTVASAGVPGGPPVPNHQRAIGANIGTGRVEGVDIPSPVYHFSESHIVPNQNVTSFYKGTLFFLTPTMNNSPFRGFARGECLFRGVVGQRRGKYGDWDLNFRFAASPNRTNIEIGAIIIASKLGWDYLWVAYGKSVDANVLVNVPVAAYVERVLFFGEFSALGIGT